MSARRLVGASKLVGAIALAMLTAPLPIRAEPPCEATVSLSRAEAWVGQPVLHRTVIVRSEALPAPRWSEPRRFPGFRVERLEATASARRIEHPSGPAVRVEERTWLLPVRSGRWRLPAARLRCGEREAVIAEVSFEARPLPEAGRPAEFQGAVGPVEIQAQAAPRVALGSSVRVHVTTRGGSDLAHGPPRPRVEPADVEQFPQPPRIVWNDGPRLRAVRYDTLDLVPRRPGPMAVGPVRVAWFDPASGAYRMAESQPLRIEVVGAGALPDGAGPPAQGAEAGRDAAQTPGDARGPGWLGWAAGGLVCLVGAGLWGLRRRAPDRVRQALRQADLADSPAQRAAALERALRTLLAERGLDVDRDPTHALLERSPDATTREWVEAFDALVRARFAGDDGGVDLDAIHARIARVRRT